MKSVILVIPPGPFDKKPGITSSNINLHEVSFLNMKDNLQVTAIRQSIPVLRLSVV